MDLLSPYVPRLLLEWGQSQPAEAWREVDATMVFVDVSGFTAMSERLARRGKVGAEEVMAVISTTFEQLLEVAYGVGGGLLKFGGDSLLLFFSGESHAARGCFAAAGMRRTLRTAGRITTSAGKVTLRMSAGVHSGTFHLFLAGNSHRELVVTGPGASATVRAESGASAGEILLSAGAVRAADPRLLGEPREGGRLLGKVPEAPPPVPAPPVSGESVARVFVPQAIRRHIEGGGAEAEHRTVALAFVKFSGIDTLIASEGPAEVAGRLDQLVTCAQEAADEHEITFLYTDIDSDGGKVLICSGAPRTFDNNEERVLRAVRRVMDSGVPLALRAGIHRGHAFTGDVGPPYRRTYTAMGDVVNTAARVMSHAAPSEILATREALDCSAAEFEAAQTEPFRVKGKSEPLVAWRVGKLAGLRRRQEDAPSPLVGREPEMAPLLWALQSAREGTGGSLAVIGEAGVGKSRLVQELQAGAEGVRTLSVSAEQYQRSTPYHCFGRLLAAALDLDARNPEALTERTSALAPELLPWLPLAALVLDVPVEQTPEVRRLDDASRAARLRQVVVELMQAALPGPSLLVIEDAQWLDEASRELLRHVEAQSGRPWLFVVAGRSAAEAAGRTTVKVGPLPHADAAALARSAAQGRLLPAASAALAERSGGNPLFLLELVAASEPGAEALPDSVEALIASRIDLLPPRDRTLLRTLSVLGASFDAKLLSTLGDEVGEPSWRRLQGFVRRRGGTFTFTQALFQQVAYEGLPFRRRVKLHDRIARAIEAQTDEPHKAAEILSLHFHHAQHYDSSWRYSRIAAGHAQSKFALREAITFWSRATDASRHLRALPAAELSETWKALGMSLVAAGRLPEAVDACRRARSLAKGRPLDRARLCYVEGGLREELGQYEQALRWYSTGLRESREAPEGADADAVRTELRLGSAGVRYLQGRFDDCIRICRVVVEGREGSASRVGMGHAYLRLHLAGMAVGDPDRASYGRRALGIFEELDVPTHQGEVLNNLGMDAYFTGDWTQALDLYERARKALAKAGNEIQAAVVQTNIAEILSDQGRLEEARTLFEEALGTLRAARSGFVPATLNNLGRLASRAGRPDEAISLLQEAAAAFADMGAVAAVAETQARMCEALAAAGKGAAALEMAARADKAAPPAVRPALERARGLALAATGKPDEARAALEASLALARELGLEHEVAWTLEALCELAGAASDERPGAREEAGRILRRLQIGTASAEAGG